MKGKDSNSEVGGYPSEYKITNDYEHIKKAMSSPAITQIIHEELRRSGILHEFYRFDLLSSFYIIKEDKEFVKMSSELFKLGFDIGKRINNGNNTLDWNNSVELIHGLDDRQLRDSSDLIAQNLVQNPIEYNYFLYTLSKLLPK